MRYTTLLLPAAMSMAAVSCTDESPTSPNAFASKRSSVVTTPASGPWARIVEDQTGPGSLYALYIPEHWNGDAVYYVHGIRPPLAPITLDDQDNFFQVRDALGAQGYAFAYSSFSENGLAVKDGAQRTHQLRGLLASELNGQRPNRSYLAGYSLGALVALELGEKFPDQYSGVLAMCGMIGGTPLELQYVGDVRALFDAYYPGVLPGSVISVTGPPLTIGEVQQRVIAAITPTPTNPQAPLGMFAIASTSQTPLAWVPGNLGDPSSPAFQTLVGSLITALYYQLIGTPDVLDRTHGHSPYDNRNVIYTMGSPSVPAPQLIPVIQAMIAASNSRVTRYDITPDAQNYLAKNYLPTGNLRLPVVSVHNVFDPLVPFFHEAAYKLVANSSMLFQRPVPNYGHCNFPTSTVVGSFQMLVDWVTTGVKPVG
jgi:pimeloyl-ACP methyl ester carboxylesterase